MNANDIDRTLADWFEADALTAAPADGLDHALAGARRRTPRRAWLAGLGSHWGWTTPRGGLGVGAQRTSLRWSPSFIAVVILGVVLLGATLMVGARLLQPSPLPTSSSGRLAYILDGDAFVADWDGQNPVRVADGLPGGTSGCGNAGYWAEGPMWAPDGRHFAFRSPRDQVDCDRPDADSFPTVLLADPAGNVVAEFPGVGWRIPWSPDSGRVATWLDRYPMTTAAVYGLDGVEQARITLPPDNAMNDGDYDPAWSPDSDSLLIPLDQDAIFPALFWDVPIDGSQPRRLPTEDPRSHRLSARSPDGTRFAWVHEVQLMVADPDGSNLRRLASGVGDFEGPIWSPTGDRIAIALGGGSRLRVIDVETGAMLTLVQGEDQDALSAIAFSPDGSRILFSRRDVALRDQSLWSVNANGSEARMLVDGTIDGDWQPRPD